VTSVRGLGRALFELVVPSICPACDMPRDPGEPLLCDFCTRLVSHTEHLRLVHTAVAYEGTGLELVRRFKFEQRRDAFWVLSAWLAARVAELAFDAIVALPRHPARVRSEGCDPVHALARALARSRGTPLVRGALQRARLTPPQTGLSVAGRRANVAGSFAAMRGALAGRRVLLLDDVATTGATLTEAAGVLRRDSGAKRVLLAAVAGTPAAVL